MKKKIQIVICCLLCFLMAACSGEKEKKGQSDEVADIVLSDKQSDMALQFVKDLTQRKYDKLQKDYAYDEQMQIVSTLLLECDTFESLRKRLHKSDKK